MEEIISTFKSDLIKPGRGVGNTTRQIDYAIQLLFEGKKIKVQDHYKEKLTHRNQFGRIMNRLSLEYGIHNKDVDYDFNNLTIKLKQK